jgi:hypothetical protein
MFQTRCERSPRKREDPLQPALDRLARMLIAEFPGREPEWAAQVSSALTTLETALRQHTAGAEGADGMLTEIDLTRPTFVRRISELRREHADFLEEVIQFQKQVQRVRQAFQAQDQPVNTLPAPAGPEAIADFGALRQRGEQLVAALQHHKEEETALTLESVTTERVLSPFL